MNKRVNRPLSQGEVVAGILEEEEITQTQAADHLGHFSHLAQRTHQQSPRFDA